VRLLPQDIGQSFDGWSRLEAPQIGGISKPDRQGLTTMTNSRFIGGRMEDSWLEKQLPQ
jgi:hypothetical protein